MVIFTKVNCDEHDNDHADGTYMETMMMMMMMMLHGDHTDDDDDDDDNVCKRQLWTKLRFPAHCPAAAADATQSLSSLSPFVIICHNLSPL